jgi:hypothetical protein
VRQDENNYCALRITTASSKANIGIPSSARPCGPQAATVACKAFCAAAAASRFRFFASCFRFFLPEIAPASLLGAGSNSGSAPILSRRSAICCIRACFLELGFVCFCTGHGRRSPPPGPIRFLRPAFRLCLPASGFNVLEAIDASRFLFVNAVKETMLEPNAWRLGHAKAGLQALFEFRCGVCLDVWRVPRCRVALCAALFSTDCQLIVGRVPRRRILCSAGLCNG